LAFVWDTGVYVSGEGGAILSNDTDGRCYILYTQPEELEEEKEPQYIQANIHGYGTSFPADWKYDPIDILQLISNRYNIPYHSLSFQAVRDFTFTNEYFTALSIHEYTKYYDIISAFALNFNFWWFINDALELELKPNPDPETEPIYAFKQEIIEYKCEGLTEVYNRLTGGYHTVNADNFFYSQYTELDRQSIEMYGEKTAEIDFYHLVGTNVPAYRGRIAHVAQDWIHYRNTPRELATIKIPLLNFIGSGVKLGDVIHVEHPDTLLPGENAYHVISISRAIYEENVTLKIRSLAGIPKPECLYTFTNTKTDDFGTITINDEAGQYPGTVNGTITFTGGVYGKYGTLDDGSGNCIQIPPLTGFPWIAPGERGATIAFWMGDGGSLALGTGTGWADSSRRFRCDYNTAWSGTNTLKTRLGPGDIGQEVTIPNINEPDIHVVVQVNPTDSGWTDYEVYINGKYMKNSTGEYNYDQGDEIIYLGAWLTGGQYEGLLKKVTHLYLLKRHLTPGEMRSLSAR
jgi:hypothetical protein